MRYRFSVFELDDSLYELRREGTPVHVEPRVLDLLFFLIRNRDRVVPREELLDTLWKEKFIGEAALSRSVMEARKAIAVEGGGEAIKTVHRRGYRFVAPVTEEKEESAGKAPPAAMPEPAMASEPLAVRESEPAFRNRGVAIISFSGVGIVTLLIAMAMAPRWIRPTAVPAPKIIRVSPDLKITRLTTSGNAIDTAISPDGRFVAYLIDDGGSRSIRMRQVATGSDTELVAGAPRVRRSLVFTPDGNYLAYLELDAGLWALYRVAALGGAPRRVVDSVEISAWSQGKDVSFGPDGDRVAFIRRLSPKTTALYVRHLATREERRIHVRNGDLFRPIWMAGGNALVCHWKLPGYSTEIRLLEIPLHPPAAAREIEAPRTPLFVAQSMLPDDQHLIAVGGHSISRTAVYLAGYPSMDLTPITQGTSYWKSPSVTPDGRQLVAVRVQENFNLWTAARGEADQRQVTSDIDAMEGTHGIDVTSSGEFVYTARANGEHNHIWISSPDGRNVRQLTSGTDDEYWPVVSPSGATIFYGQRQTGKTRSMRIWRMDLATGNSRQLTSGSWDMLPVVTRDGRWIIYTEAGGEAPLIRRVPASGGSPETIAEGIMFAPDISPDGTLLAGLYARTMSDQRALVTMRIEDGSIVERFPAAWAGRWAADGGGLIVIRESNGVGNLWLYPLGGGTPRQLTDFRSLRILAFNRLPDRKHYVLSRGEDVSDVVLIGDLLDNPPQTALR
jgi:DNA-binding winged helix-turn-helix (wHTH) protein/Tol biopolymer transport system component